MFKFKNKVIENHKVCYPENQNEAFFRNETCK